MQKKRNSCLLSLLAAWRLFVFLTGDALLKIPSKVCIIADFQYYSRYLMTSFWQYDTVGDNGRFSERFRHAMYPDLETRLKIFVVCNIYFVSLISWEAGFVFVCPLLISRYFKNRRSVVGVLSRIQKSKYN